MRALSRQSGLRFVWLVAGFVVVAATACTAVQPPPQPTRFSVAGPLGAQLVSPKVSPDGQTIAFTAWVRGKG